MKIRTWPIARSNQSGVYRLCLPQRLGNGELYTDSRYQTFPSLEEVVGEDWYPAIIAKLIDDVGFAAWWTKTKILKKSGLLGYSPAALPDHLDLSDPGGHLFLTKSFIPRAKKLLVADLAVPEIVDSIRHWFGIDTEFDIEFFFVPPNGKSWDMSPIQDWCKEKKQWSYPEKLVPEHAERIIAIFDGDIYCVMSKAAAKVSIQLLTALAESWQLNVIPGPERYSWLPNLH